MEKRTGLAVGVLSVVLMLVSASIGKAQVSNNTVSLHVLVPPNAKVWISDQGTTQTGAERYFESPPLMPDHNYYYDVKAQWLNANGNEITQTQHIAVRANARLDVDFINPVDSSRNSTLSTVVAPNYSSGYYWTDPDYSSGYYRTDRGYSSGYYRVGNVIINGRRWGDIGSRYSHADLIRW